MEQVGRVETVEPEGGVQGAEAQQDAPHWRRRDVAAVGVRQVDETAYDGRLDVRQAQRPIKIGLKSEIKAKLGHHGLKSSRLPSSK